jgi:hypothetical protein
MSRLTLAHGDDRRGIYIDGRGAKHAIRERLLALI